MFLAWRCLKERKLKDMVLYIARSALQFVRVTLRGFSPKALAWGKKGLRGDTRELLRA